MFSWRQLIGVFREVTQLLQLPFPGAVVFGSAYRLRNACPPGLRRFPWMRLFANAEPVSGSIGVGSVQPGIDGPLKSPALSAAVGTKAVRTVPRVSLFHSCDPKNCSLFLMIGPPKV